MLGTLFNDSQKNSGSKRFSKKTRHQNMKIKRPRYIYVLTTEDTQIKQIQKLPPCKSCAAANQLGTKKMSWVHAEPSLPHSVECILWLRPVSLAF
jgi:hypothetical protein